MRGSQSPEWKIRSGLAQIGCSETAFCKIAEFTHSNFSVIMADKGKDFTAEQAEMLRELLDEMVELQLFVGRDIPIAWAVVDKVRNALCIQRIKQISRELGYEDAAIQNLIVDAPTMVSKVREDLSKPPESGMSMNPNGL